MELPVIGLSDAGKAFLSSDDKETILLRQLLKFQIPSPYHPLGKGAAGFKVKPYLELFRLIYDLNGLSFDELVIFGMQLIDYRKYNTIIEKVRKFRENKRNINESNISYKRHKDQIFNRELQRIYCDEIKTGAFKTRESFTDSAVGFIAKKKKNLRDYADAAVRNLRSTGLVSVTAVHRSITILPERRKDVEFFLSSLNREPVYVNDIASYQEYLWNPHQPLLLSDNKNRLLSKLKAEFGLSVTDDYSIEDLNQLLKNKVEERKLQRIAAQIRDIKSYNLYENIENTFCELNSSYDPSLFLEWNVWRAMTMLDGGQIKANLKFDDNGEPMSTALGNMADIICDYNEFDVIVEVTMAKGTLQWKMEGEPIPRHIGIHKKQSNNPTYCFFIAQSLNPATIAHFFTLYITNVELYGGRCCIIPLSLSTFRTMLKKAVEAPTKPDTAQIHKLFDTAKSYADECFAKGYSETEWFNRITKKATDWLTL